MRLKLDDGSVLTAHVGHSNLPDSVVKDHAPRFRGATVVGVHFGHCHFIEGVRGCQVPQVYGEAYCSRLDNFNKATGRKLAFTRAIASYSRSIRTQLWKSFREGGIPRG